MTLEEEVDRKRSEIRTDDYGVSIGEWISIYDRAEIDIHPEFQRFFRWSDRQKTNLIESILLGIPIPPVFVSQRDDGIWDVVDGLQRLSTIYQLAGILKDEDGRRIEPLTLNETEYLPSLEGKVWGELPRDAAPNEKEAKNSLGSKIRLIIKRSKLNVSIIEKESDPDAKFELFQRLNTGGSSLSPQEVRNCILVMLNKDMYLWMKRLAERESFKLTTALTDKAIDEAYDIELILRFILFLDIDNKGLKSIGDVGNFLTEGLKLLANNSQFDRDRYERLFNETFDVLARRMGEDSFKPFNASKERFLGGFALSQYETVSSGVGYNIANSTLVEDISSAVKSLYIDEEFRGWVGSGVRAQSRLPKIIPYGREKFRR